MSEGVEGEWSVGQSLWLESSYQELLSPRCLFVVSRWLALVASRPQTFANRSPLRWASTASVFAFETIVSACPSAGHRSRPVRIEIFQPAAGLVSGTTTNTADCRKSEWGYSHTVHAATGIFRFRFETILKPVQRPERVLPTSGRRE